MKTAKPTFQFISSYQGEFDFRRIGDESGRRYRINANQGNKLTVGYAEPTPQELADFQAWQRERLDLDQLQMLAKPWRYPREFWQVMPEPRHLAR